jgi:hypothetical protein
MEFTHWHEIWNLYGDRVILIAVIAGVVIMVLRFMEKGGKE